MRTAVVVLVVIVVVFAATVFMGARRSGPSAGDGSPQPNADGTYDQDSVSNWQPKGMLASGGPLFAGLGPKLKLDDPHVALGPNQTVTRDVPPPPPRSRLLSMAGDTRTAHVAITKGAGILRVAYQCGSGQGDQCSQSVCLCSPGAVFTALQILSCPKGWRDKRLAGEACTKETAKASLVIYPEAGQMSFSALGPSSFQAEVR
jgi:hypothetical protein